MSKPSASEQISDIKPLDDETQGYIGSEISHDYRCLDDGPERVRWNNRAMGRALVRITRLQAYAATLEAENKRLREALEQLANANLHDGNCDSLMTASKRIRNIARRALNPAKEAAKSE